MMAAAKERGKGVSSLLHFIDNISKWTGRVVSFLIVALTFLICFEVVARYLLNRPTIWVNEASAMLFGTYIIIGGPIPFTLEDMSTWMSFTGASFQREKPL